MKVYVSTTSKRLDLAKRAMEEVRNRGWTITHDWTIGFETEWKASPDEMTRRAIADIEGVQRADAVLLVMCPEMRSIGAMIEIGAAIGLNKPVVVADEGAKFDHLFARHPNVYCSVGGISNAIHLLGGYH